MTRDCSEVDRSAGLGHAGRPPASEPVPERTPAPRTPPRAAVGLDVYRQRTLTRGVNSVLYRVVRSLIVPFFLLYFRMSRVGREHLPRSGPLLLASNHRSFLDPFVIGTLVRRPVYYVAKSELFANRLVAWLLNGLGAFPLDRGAGDAEAMRTARAILERGDCVVIFPEGTRVRPGPLGDARRGVGRLALQTGAPVAPVAVFGSEDVRRGLLIRPRKVRLRAGAPLRFPIVQAPSPALAKSATGRIWARVGLQWEWLGGEARTREALPRPSANPARQHRRAPQSPPAREQVPPAREQVRAA